MAYVIRRSNGFLQSVEDESIDRTYAVGLLGDDTVNYGQNMAQTLLQNLENYAHEFSPENNPNINYDNQNGESSSITPLTGQLWYDTINERVNVYNSDPDSVRHGWTAITSSLTGIIGNVTSQTDQEADIGTDTLRWHTFYGTHLDVNTNRRDFETLGPGYPDPHDIPALNVDGVMQLGSTSKIDDPAVGKFIPSGLAIIGDEGLPFESMYANTMRFGIAADAGFRVHPDGSKTNYILPSSLSDQSTPSDVGVHLGDIQYPFTDSSVITTKTDNLVTMTGTTIALGTDTVVANLIPVTDNSTTLGALAQRFSNVNTLALNTAEISNCTIYWRRGDTAINDISKFKQCSNDISCNFSPNSKGE